MVVSETRGGGLAPLAGVRILDATVSVSGAFCSTLLARLGAAVTRLDLADDGAGPRSLFLDEHLRSSEVYAPYLARRAEVVEVDPASATGADDIDALVGAADVVITDRLEADLEAVGLARRDIGRRHPDVVVVAISPFGSTGPRAGMPASDLTLYHGGGPGHATPGLVADPATMEPLRLGSHQGLFVSGLAAAINVCAAVLLRTRHPDVDSVSVDFSCHEAIASVFRMSLGTFAFYGGGLSRDLARGRGAGGTVEHRNIRCRNGYVNIAWAGVQQWDSLKDLLGRPEWMDDERLSTPPLRYRNWALLVPQLEAWAIERDKEEIFYLCQAHRIPCSPVNEGSDLLSSEVLESRGFWDSVDIGPDTIRLPGAFSRVVLTTD
jgi:crotonobetainyl-CoA:carnitine CoA-transferase CaiB-like acyl-CoA transferase